MSSQTVLVPHTHWDREWYEPFQVFRLRLVEVLDDVIERAERDPELRFTVDGQLAAVDDYLEIRPENRDRVAALVAGGQLAVGPWLILLDEFLCSGETIVRNLEMGWHGASALGGAMPVGYLPDMFGHCAQMPQILARAGIAHACLWRGVPAAVDAHAFRWAAPDGSAVRVEYLWDGYGNGVDLLADPTRLAEAAAAYRDGTGSWYGDDPVLAMLGGDHSRPRPELMDLVRSAALDVATLGEYIARCDAGTRLPTVHGELRSHARGNILPGVLSVRVGLKHAMAAAERMAAMADALAARLPEGRFERYREQTWRRIVESSAHDSVTGCGVDETAGQVEARLAEAVQLGRAVRDTVVRSLADPVPSDAYLVVNPRPRPWSGLVELDVPVPEGAVSVAAELPDGTALPVQETARSETLLAEEKLAAGDLELLVRRIHGRELFGQKIERYAVVPPPRVDHGRSLPNRPGLAEIAHDQREGGCVTFELAEVPESPRFDKAELQARLEAAAAEHPGTWTVRTVAQQRRRLLAAVPVPASGDVAVRARAGGAAPPVDFPVVVDGRVLDNGEVRAEVDDDGTLTVQGADGTELAGVGRLVDGGDRGDSYNYGPPARDRLISDPAAVRVESLEAGPLRGTLRVTREYDWPVGLSGDADERSADTVRVPVTTLVSLGAGEPFVRLEVSFVNRAADHRLRLHVPLPAAAATSAADGQFAVTRRGLSGEPGWGEYPLPTYPASSFVSAGHATVLLDRVTEYELVDGGAEIALTLLRAVGWMSVNVHPLRDEPAGPERAVPGAQYLGRDVRTRLAVLPARGGWSAVDAPRLAADFSAEPVVQRGRGQAGGELPGPAEGVSVSGDGVTATSVRPSTEGSEVRLVAMTEEPTTAVVRGPFGAARRTDLLGRPLEELPVTDGRLAVDLGPWEIATIRLSDLSGRTTR